ncbi:MAG TPA: DUF1801 domain-containing protein [Candidatus Dormibacteraeota bacterium]|jgi:hypothetical protein
MNKPARATKVFTEEERLAIAQRAREVKAARRGAGAADGEADVRAKLASMQAPDRALGERLHALIRATAPGLSPRLWYGMPAYSKEGKMICFFQDAHKFKTRYATLGFSDAANLDEGGLWPVAYALKRLTGAEEKKIRALVKQAVS